MINCICNCVCVCMLKGKQLHRPSAHTDPDVKRSKVEHLFTKFLWIFVFLWISGHKYFIKCNIHVYSPWQKGSLYVCRYYVVIYTSHNGSALYIALRSIVASQSPQCGPTLPARPMWPTRHGALGTGSARQPAQPGPAICVSCFALMKQTDHPIIII